MKHKATERNSTASRRGNDEGTIVQRADGRWESGYFIPRGTGRQRISVYGRTREDVAKQLRARLVERDRGRVDAPTRKTLQTYLPAWLNEQRLNREWKPTTFQAAECATRTQLAPLLGNVALSRLRAPHVQQLITDMLDAGLWPKYVRNVHAVLPAPLERAVEQDRNTENPASTPRVRLPERSPREMTTLDAD